VWGRLVATFRARLLALPSKLAGRLVGISEARAIHGRIESEVYDALTELSDEVDSYARPRVIQKGIRSMASREGVLRIKLQVVKRGHIELFRLQRASKPALSR
jgi:hypothetical protein